MKQITPKAHIRTKQVQYAGKQIGDEKSKNKFATSLLFYIFVGMKAKINWDALGIMTSILCAIHCAILPLFLAALPLFGVNIINNTAFEIGMILVAFAIGCYALWHGYKLHHHRWQPLLLFTLGILFLILKQVFLRFHTVLLIPAVLCIVSAHLFNYRFCRKHHHAHAGDCSHDHY